jgi:AraC family transcriptional activator of tynA and feaB
MRTYFDSSLYSAAQQYAAWREASASAFYPVDLDAREGDHVHGFDAHISGMTLGALELMEVRTSSMLSTHSRKRSVEETKPSMFISLMLEGEARIEDARRDVAQQPGDIVVWDSTQPAMWDVQHSLHSFVLRVPLRLVEARATRVDRIRSGTLKAHTSMGQLAGRLISNAAQLREIAPGSAPAQRLGTSLLDVVIAGLEVEGAAASAGSAESAGERRNQDLLRAKDYLLSHLDDPEIAVDTVANALHVSSRTLNRLFAAEGQTAMRWLWQQRLERSRQMLAQRKSPRVAEVALACGFTSFSHFSNAFRRAYSASPSRFVQEAAPVQSF